MRGTPPGGRGTGSEVHGHEERMGLGAGVPSPPQPAGGFLGLLIFFWGGAFCLLRAAPTGSGGSQARG